MTTIDAPAPTDLTPWNPAEMVGDPGSPEHRERIGRGAVELARIYRENTETIRRACGEIHAACRNLTEALRPAAGSGAYYREFTTHLEFGGKTYHDHPGKPAADAVVREMNRRAWDLLIDRLGIKPLMSIKRREEFEKQLRDGDVPEVSEEAILGVLMGLAGQAKDFATEAAKEALELLTPSGHRYKTNSGFKVGRRVILTWMAEEGYSGGFRVGYQKEAQVNAIDGTFHVLDGKGVIRGRKGPLAAAIDAAEDGRGETEYFKFRACKNRNLHLEFKRIDLVKQLNGLATGEFILGHDPE